MSLFRGDSHQSDPRGVQRNRTAKLTVAACVAAALFLFLVGAFLLVIGRSPQAARERPAVSSDRSTNRAIPVPQPPEPSYTILNTETMPGIKRAVDVRLDRRVREDSLRRVSLEVRDKDRRPYRRTFITFSLPGMQVGTGAWAVATFEPELSLRFLGLTVEEEAAILRRIAADTRTLVGVWMDDRPSCGSITIYQRNNTYHWEQVFKDGSLLEYELLERPSTSGRKFQQRRRQPFGEYFVVEPGGALALYDRDGLISRARRIR